MTARRTGRAAITERFLSSFLGLTQEELGERLGVRKNTVWRWEKEQRRVPETVVRLVQYLVKEVRAKKRKNDRP
ncbi:MAG: helix-turn-helix domain-containing protein [Candidatus Binatia bacterium]